MPDGGPKLLILDGNNLSHRAYWAHKELSYNGRCTGLLFGFFKALVSLHKSYPDYFRVVVWDRGYTRRLEESTKAVEAGIIPMAYKANRRQAEEEMSPDERKAREDIHEQMDEVKSALEFVRCLQVSIEGVEGDDLAYTYAKQAQADGGDAVVVSSDLDFMQVLDEHIAVFDAMKHEKWTKERFQIEFCFDPALWVDVGALEGEQGPTKDGIYGVDGWGPKTACKYVKEFGTIEKIIEAVKAKEKQTKKEQTLLNSIPRAMLAKSLKRMDFIPNLPRPRVLRKYDSAELERYFLTFRFASLLKDAWRLV
jgi:DNA polymerase-1